MDRIPIARTKPDQLKHVEGAGPDRRVPRGEDEPWTNSTGRGARRERAFPEPFQAPWRADPNVALIVFQQRSDDVGQQPVLLSELLGLGTELLDASSADPRRIEDAAQAVAERTDPETPLPVNQQRPCPDLHLGDRSPIAEPGNGVRGSVHLGHPDRAVPGLGEHRLRRLRQESHARVDEPLCAGGEIDHPVFNLHPQRIPSGEPNARGLGPGDPPLAAKRLPPSIVEAGQPVHGRGHHHAGAGLGQLNGRRQPVMLAIGGQATTAQVTDRAARPDDPQTAITRLQQAPDAPHRNRVATRRRERDEPDPIEANQARHGSHPEVAVPRLRQ